MLLTYIHYLIDIVNSVYFRVNEFYHGPDNKRLDEWVSEDRLDTRKVQYPRKDGQPSTGLSTPKKVYLISNHLFCYSWKLFVFWSIK